MAFGALCSDVSCPYALNHREIFLGFGTPNYLVHFFSFLHTISRTEYERGQFVNVKFDCCQSSMIFEHRWKTHTGAAKNLFDKRLFPMF